MRKRSIAVVVAFVMSAVTMAFGAQQQQGKMGQMPTVDEQVARMKTNLNLTDQQAAQVKELFTKQREEAKTWRSNNPNPTSEQLRTHRRQMWEERDAGLKKILTPEQYQKHQEMMKQQMKKHGMKRGPKGPPQN